MLKESLPLIWVVRLFALSLLLSICLPWLRVLLSLFVSVYVALIRDLILLWFLELGRWRSPIQGIPVLSSPIIVLLLIDIDLIILMVLLKGLGIKGILLLLLPHLLNIREILLRPRVPLFDDPILPRYHLLLQGHPTHNGNHLVDLPFLLLHLIQQSVPFGNQFGVFEADDFSE
jgi:hypothetical protein